MSLAETPRIIVAEDSEPNRAIITHLIHKMGYQVIECEDGAQAWECLDQIAAENNPAPILAVISDILMPNQDGLWLLRQVRSDIRWNHLPFIFVTGVTEKEKIDEAKHLGANGYLVKPFGVIEIESRIIELLAPMKSTSVG